MQIGDKVRFTPAVSACETREGAHGPRLAPQRVTGRVVYIHPRHRFYIVEWEIGGRRLRESRYFDSGEEQ